jgi:hypothetical protein
VPLSSASLAAALEDLFAGAGGHPADEAEAGRRWAAAYRGYAARAVAGTTAPLDASLRGAQQTLAGTLAGGFATTKAAGPGGAAALAAIMDAAFVAFWLVPPVAFAVPPTGPPTMTGVVSAAPPGVLTAPLSARFLIGVAQQASAAQQAQALAAALDAWTRTVLVVNTPVVPPGPPLPPVPLA